MAYDIIDDEIGDVGGGYDIIDEMDAPAAPQKAVKAPQRPPMHQGADISIPTSGEPTITPELLKSIPGAIGTALGEGAYGAVKDFPQFLTNLVSGNLPTHKMAQKYKEETGEYSGVPGTPTDWTGEKAAGAGDFASKFLHGAALEGSAVSAGAPKLVGAALGSLPYARETVRGGDIKGGVAEVLTDMALDQVFKGGGKLLKSAGDAGKLAEKAIPSGLAKNIPTGQADDMTEILIDLSKPKQMSGLSKTLRKVDLPEAEWRTFANPLQEGSVPFDEYAVAADVFARNRNAVGPDKLANAQFTKALNDVDMARQQVGKQIGDLVSQNADKTVSVAPIRDSYVRQAETVLNGTFDESGKLRPVQGRMIAIDPAEAARAEELFAQLATLPDEVPVGTAQDLKQIVRQHAKYGTQTGIPVSSPRLALLTKQVAAEIDGSLDDVLGPQYSALNAQYGKHRRLAENMGRIAGAEIDPDMGLSKHGSNVMKRAVWSLADGGTRDMFRQVQDITGRDLMQDALYANLAMRFSGDPMQAMAGEPGVRGLSSLLKGGGGVGERLLGAGEKHLQSGQLQALADFYTKQQGRAPIKLGSREALSIPMGGAPDVGQPF